MTPLRSPRQGPVDDHEHPAAPRENVPRPRSSGRTADRERTTSDVTEQAARIRDVAREVFGWEHLKPGQAEAIETLVGGRDVLAVMPTGYGKSAIYQIAGLERPGPCVGDLRTSR